MKKNLRFLFSLAITLILAFACFASEDKKCGSLDNLKAQIGEGKSPADITAGFDELRECYCLENKYNGFVEDLKSLLAQAKIQAAPANYYIALTRYFQLDCLQAKQIWDEYFNQGSGYMDELVTRAQEAIKETTAKDVIHVYARLLLWEFYRVQEDVSSMDALTGLMQATTDYAKEAKDNLPIKIVADKILAGGEKIRARELYRIYIGKITSSEAKDEELKDIAAGFYKEKNLDLAEVVYDAYIERIVKSGTKESAVAAMFEIAKLFAYSDTGANDPFYAEKVFERIESFAGKDALTQELLYLRAYNLEKGKEFKKARDTYLVLLERFPETSHTDEVLYKIGIVNAYFLRDKGAAREYFMRLAGKEAVSPQVICALYQLGLLSQWEEESAKAKEYYNKAIEWAKDKYQDTGAFVRARLKEIEENRAIEYNLKTFLDASLKPENSQFNMTKAGLVSSPYQAKTGEGVKVASSAVSDKSGCMQAVMLYHWSGNTGTTKPTPDKAGFETSYTEPGTKEVFLVIISPPDIVDRDFVMVDIR